MERKIESKNSFRSGREGIKFRDLEKKYPAEKAKKLVTLLRAKNLWYWDEDFPGDEEERGVQKRFRKGFRSCISHTTIQYYTQYHHTNLIHVNT